jgi:hypothetical protein
VTENEKLRALLAEAQSRLACERYRDTWEDCDCADCDLKARIEAALAEPEVRWGTRTSWPTLSNNPSFPVPSDGLKHTAMVDGYYIVVAPTPLGVTWQAFPERKPYKEAFLPKKTVEEAKEAALKAVRSPK